jgi:hypothetical protein
MAKKISTVLFSIPLVDKPPRFINTRPSETREIREVLLINLLGLSTPPELVREARFTAGHSGAGSGTGGRSNGLECK